MARQRYNAGIQRVKGMLELASGLYDTSLSHQTTRAAEGVQQTDSQLAALHPLKSRRYLQEVILPNIETGLARRGRQRKDIELTSSIFVIPTDDTHKAALYEAEVRQQISFYASTPPYRPVFALHEWADVATQLSKLAAGGKWQEMPSLITDEMLAAFSLKGSWEELPRTVLA